LPKPTNILFAAIALTLVRCTPTALPPPEPAVAKNNTFLRVCAVCHGINGEGNQQLGAPSIAALPRWYLEEQILRFRNGWRGAHPEDITGQLMRGIIVPLTDAELKEAINYATALPQKTHPPTLGGDAKNGAWFYEMECMGCHRYNGHGEMTFYSGPVSGLQDWYLLAQLEKFRKGIRGYHPKDEQGRKMNLISTGLSIEELKDILAFISELSESYPQQSAHSHE
jgi:cytochrome c553